MIEAISYIMDDIKSTALNIAYCSVWYELIKLMNSYFIDNDVVYFSLVARILESLPHA